MQKNTKQLSNKITSAKKFYLNCHYFYCPDGKSDLTIKIMHKFYLIPSYANASPHLIVRVVIYLGAKNIAAGKKIFLDFYYNYLCRKSGLV